jgi:putative DNA primase/helicase
MVSFPEIQQGGTLDASLVKQLTGGDNLTARNLGENSFEFLPQCKLILHTNHLPQCSDLSVFDSGRALVLTFGRHFEPWEQDKGLKAELRKPENQSGILNWLIQGFKEYQKRGLTPPKSVQIATQEYRKDSDKVARFVEETLNQDTLGEVRLTLLYSAYKIWCRDNGLYPESSRNFRRSLEQTGVHFARKRPDAGGENTTMVMGYSLLSECDLIA